VVKEGIYREAPSFLVNGCWLLPFLGWTMMVLLHCNGVSGLGVTHILASRGNLYSIMNLSLLMLCLSILCLLRSLEALGSFY